MAATVSVRTSLKVIPKRCRELEFVGVVEKYKKDLKELFL